MPRPSESRLQCPRRLRVGNSDPDAACISCQWKNRKVAAELSSWQDVHRSIKAAKIGFRRPHPDVPIGARGSDVNGTMMFCGMRSSALAGVIDRDFWSGRSWRLPGLTHYSGT